MTGIKSNYIFQSEMKSHTLNVKIKLWSWYLCEEDIKFNGVKRDAHLSYFCLDSVLIDSSSVYSEYVVLIGIV